MCIPFSPGQTRRLEAYRTLLAHPQLIRSRSPQARGVVEEQGKAVAHLPVARVVVGNDEVARYHSLEQRRVRASR